MGKKKQGQKKSAISLDSKKGKSMNKYHLVLANGSERDITAESVEVENGTLILKGQYSGEPVVIYAPGTWLGCEVERKDDRE